MFWQFILFKYDYPPNSSYRSLTEITSSWVTLFHKIKSSSILKMCPTLRYECQRKNCSKTFLCQKKSSFCISRKTYTEYGCEMKLQDRNKKHETTTRKKRTLAARTKISFVSAMKEKMQKEGSIEVNHRLEKWNLSAIQIKELYH